MWERRRDPNHLHHSRPRHGITRTPPEQRAPGTEGLCHAIYTGETAHVSPELRDGRHGLHHTTREAFARTPCTFAAHHTGPHSWETR